MRDTITARAGANIGIGSGLTAEIILSHAGPRALDVIEIEPAMAIGAYTFHPRVDRLFRDRRVKVSISRTPTATSRATASATT